MTDCHVEVDASGPVISVGIGEVVHVLTEMETGKVPVPSVVSLELIAANGEVWIRVTVELCRRVLDVNAR